MIGVAGELILIVEDNDKNLKLARDLLRYRGYRTLETARGTDSVSLAAEQHPDLILMDVQLPDTDGVTALRRLRAHPATRTIPVVALTAFAMAGDRDRLLAAGFDGYLAKPIDTRRFVDEVARYCRGEWGG